MNFSIKTCLMACCALLFSSATVLAQVPPCDPASAPGAPGSCQVSNETCPNGGCPDCYVCHTQAAAPNVCEPPFASETDICASMTGGGKGNVNDCRIGSCLPGLISRFGNPPNPTGCDYIVDPSPTPIPQCFQCVDATSPFSHHCPDGSCEPGLGENINNCPLDCLVPGITPTPLPTQAEMDNACNVGITFEGPPFNQISGFCEDGNVCTQDFCSGGTCGHRDLNTVVDGCSEDTSDLCCPSQCHAPVPGQDCANDRTCDIDCKPQVACPNPTPTPTPVPPALKCIEGSGFGSAKSGLPTCKGFSCSLNPIAEEAPGFALLVLVISGLGYGAYRNFRRNQG